MNRHTNGHRLELLFSGEAVNKDWEVWGPETVGTPGVDAIEPIINVEDAFSAPLPQAGHFRVRCPNQPVAKLDSLNEVTFFNSDLIECGEPFGKTLPSSSGYNATAVEVTGGFYTDPEGEHFGRSNLVMNDNVLVSEGGGTGVALTKGGAEGGWLTTAFLGYHSCISGFGTDVMKDTSGSSEREPVYQVFYYQDPNNPSYEVHGFRQPNVHSYLNVGAGGEISLYGYNEWADKSELYSINEYEEPIQGDTNLRSYSHLLVVLSGPISHSYTQTYNSDPPIVPLYVRFRPTSGAPYRELYISLPPSVDINSTDPDIAFLVGSTGETYRMPEWGSVIDSVLPSGDSLQTLAPSLASEWAEMWLRGTAYRTSQGNVSVDTSVGSD